jgi:hypothetical protein
VTTKIAQRLERHIKNLPRSRDRIFSGEETRSARFFQRTRCATLDFVHGGSHPLAGQSSRVSQNAGNATLGRRPSTSNSRESHEVPEAWPEIDLLPSISIVGGTCIGSIEAP